MNLRRSMRTTTDTTSTTEGQAESSCDHVYLDTEEEERTRLWGKNRCLVEDSMVMKPQTEVVLLVPTNFPNIKDILNAFRDNSPQIAVHGMSVGTSETVLNDGRVQFYIIQGVVATAPKCDEVQNGGIADISHAFGIGNFGSNIVLFNDKGDEIYQLLITWREVYESRIHGIQVWTSINKLRDCKSNFDNVYRNEQRLLKLLHCLYEELYGDSLQLMFLLSRYYKAMVRNKQATINKLEQQNKEKVEDVPKNIEDSIQVMGGENFIRVIESVNNEFEKAFEQCFYSFSAITQPLIHGTTLDKKLIKLYKMNASAHYNMMKSVLGFDKRENLQKNKHLLSSQYYDKVLFFNFLSQVRLKNPQKVRPNLIKR